MSQVLVNDGCLYRGKTGVSLYLRNVLNNWPMDAAIEPVGFWRQLPSFYRGLRQKPTRPAGIDLVPLSELGAPRRLAWRIPIWARRLVQDRYARRFVAAFARGSYAAVFEPNHLAIDCGGPTVATMHDLSVLEHPQWHPPDRVAMWETGLEASLGATTLWIADSQFTCGRMIELLGIPPERITVASLAARPLAASPSEPARQAPPNELPSHYFLCVGTIEPRKNLLVLLDAWREFLAGGRGDWRLIIAGGIGWGSSDFFRSIQEHPAAGQVLWARHLADAGLAQLLSGADALVLPSLYEGFGLPILEAMAAGTPVICSEIPAFVEVAGSAAARVPPQDVSGWVRTLRRAAAEPQWLASLAEQGTRRAADFSWERCARQHCDVLARVAGLK